MNNIPLSDASLSEVLARVTYRLIERRLVLDNLIRYPASELLTHLVHQLDRHGFSALSFWASAYNYALSQGELPEYTRAAFVMRARMGMDFRSVAFVEYKGSRRRDPRVTNRGVRAKVTKEG